MGEIEEQRYVCRICSKPCVSGKSLGGHMRAHLASKKSPLSSSCVEEFGDGDAANSCRECGKEFGSSRALSGHMRCHSIKNRKGVHFCKECGRGFESVRAVFGHMKSHSKRVIKVASVVAVDNFCPVRRKRSKIKYDGAVSVDPSFSGVDASELEEAARCLVMLSRGVGGFSKPGSDCGDSDYFGGVVASCGSDVDLVANASNVSEFDDAEVLRAEKGMEVDLDVVCDEGFLKDGVGSNGGDGEKGADLEMVEGVEEEEEEKHDECGGEEGQVEREMGSARGSLRGAVSMRRCSSLLEMDAVAVIW